MPNSATPKLSGGDQKQAPCWPAGKSLDQNILTIATQPERFAMTHLVRSDSQTSIESVQDMVREKEEKWRQRHQNSAKRKVRIQTLI